MPHQCLSCGHLVGENNASEVLQGCSQCKGTKFFYTESPLDDDGRKDMAKNAQKDLRQVVTEMLQKDAPGVVDVDGEEYAELKAKDLRKLVKHIQAKQEAGEEWVNEEVSPLDGGAKQRREAIEDEVAEKRAKEARPDTVDVGDGKYGLDIQGLLEKDPIVVHKDGAYLIHLPSLFGKE